MNDGRTTWIVQRNIKRSFVKNERIKTKVFFTEQTNFSKDFDKNYRFLLNERFFGTNFLKTIGVLLNKRFFSVKLLK